MDGLIARQEIQLTRRVTGEEIVAAAKKADKRVRVDPRWFNGEAAEVRREWEGHSLVIRPVADEHFMLKRSYGVIVVQNGRTRRFKLATDVIARVKELAEKLQAELAQGQRS